MQAKENIFEDVLALKYLKSFMGKFAYYPLPITKNQWEHKPFRVLWCLKKVNQIMHVLCAMLYQDIVALAVLNAIGPEIDSKFHSKSYEIGLQKDLRLMDNI